MLEKVIKQLAEFRADKSLWSKLAWKKQETEEAYWDEQENRRAEILMALQFDKKTTDEEFIRYLLIEETKNRANDPFQGGSDILNRAGYLLASFRNPENVIYFLDAKTANFDTHFGFDWEHILSAGVEVTFTEIESLEKEYQEIFYDFFENLETCPLSEEDIQNWLQGKSTGWYPQNFQDLDLSSKIDLAFELNDQDSARKFVAELERTMDRREASLETLRYYRGKLKDVLEEIKLAEELLSFPKDNNLRAFDFIRISQLYLEVGNSEKAWETIREAIALKRKLDKGRLGQIADACIAIINTSELYHDFFPACYRFAKQHLGYIQSPQQKQAMVLAAKRIEDAFN